MRTNKLLLSVILFLILAGKVNSMPIYTDEIPQSRIDAANKTNKIVEISTNEKNKLEDATLNQEKKVLIYSEKKVAVKYVKKELPKPTYVIEPNVGHKLEFVVAEDVLKNGKVYIKKGALVEGIVTKVVMHDVTEATRAPEVHISLFTTSDTTGKKIDLSGTVSNKSRVNFITWLLAGYAFSPAKIKKDKIYTIYYR